MFFWNWISLAFFPYCPQTMIFLISTSLVARVTDTGLCTWPMVSFFIQRSWNYYRCI
jgi:hypothetical protein